MTRLVGVSLEQATHCEHLGSRFMARLLRLLANHWPIDTALTQRLEAWQGDIDPNGASLPLRLAAALDALVLTGQAPQLRTNYPPHQTSDNQLFKAVQTTMTQHHILSTIGSDTPQTNEVARSAGLIPTAMWLQQHHQLPICLSELGASAGLDLGFDHFALTVSRHRFGPGQPVLHLTPDWHGPVPTGIWPHITERRDVDFNPLDPRRPEDATRLTAYLWLDQPKRIARTHATIAHHSAVINTGDAIDWLAHRLEHPRVGQLHLIYHTIAWQYFPRSQQARGRALLAHAVGLAFNRADTTGQSGAAIRLRLWLANVIFSLRRAGFHSPWIDWTPPI